MTTGNSTIGNPSPIGLVGFAVGAIFFGLFEAGLLEKQGKEIVTSYGFWASGLGQVFTAVVHLLAHGNTFACLVFGFYGVVWLTICSVWDSAYTSKDALGAGSGYQGAKAYPDAECLFLVLVGVVSTFFTLIALRHNKALPTALAFVAVACYLLAGGQYSEKVKKAGGIFLALAGLTAFYMMVAEIVNLEFKREVMPGISRPLEMFAPKKEKSDVEAGGAKHSDAFSYNAATNTLKIKVGHSNGAFLSRAAVDGFFAELNAFIKKQTDTKVHAEVSYDGAEVGEGVAGYWQEKVQELEGERYLSVRRIGFSSAFGLQRRES